MTWNEMWHIFKRPHRQEQPRAQHTGQEAGPENASPDPIIRAIEDTREAILQQLHTDSDQAQRNEDRSYCVAKWAVIGAWVYATIAALSLLGILYSNHLTRQQVEISRKALDVAGGGKTMKFSRRLPVRRAGRVAHSGVRVA